MVLDVGRRYEMAHNTKELSAIAVLVTVILEVLLGLK
jgi:hypothetical protein